jgi:hypothetical protein
MSRETIAAKAEPRHDRGGGGVTVAYEFCRECSSWFCPHVAAWMHEDVDGAIAAWSDVLERKPEPVEPKQQEIPW